MIGSGAPKLSGALVACGAGQVTITYRSGLSATGPYGEVQTYVDADLYVPTSTALLAKEPERPFTHPDTAEPDPRITSEAELMIDR